MGSFHKIRTAHGSILLVETATGHIANGPDRAAGTVPLIAFQPAPGSPCVYLAAQLPGGIKPLLRPLEGVGNLVPAPRTRPAEDDTFAIYSPVTGLFLAPAKPEDGRTAHVTLTAMECKGWEKFRLIPADAAEIPWRLAKAASALRSLYAPDISIAAIIALVQKAEADEGMRDVLNAVSLGLAPAQMAELAQALMREDGLRQRLRQIFPDDLAAQLGLPTLSAWARDREDVGVALPKPKQAPGEVEVLGMDTDPIGKVGVSGQFVSMPHACMTVARQSIVPRWKSCVLATARNEGRALIEWVAHYKLLGFDQIFLYTNNNDDGSDALLSALHLAGELIWTRNVVAEDTKPQWKAYGHALQLRPEILDFAWTLVVDLDEFLEFNGEVFDTIGSYLDWCERRTVDAIAFNWLVHGSNGEAFWRNATLRERFPYRRRLNNAGSHVSPFVKSMFRTSKFSMAQAHYPTAFQSRPFHFCAASMQPYSYDPAKGAGQSLTQDISLAWITHYFFKSNEEFLWKFLRARADHEGAADREFTSLTAAFLDAHLKSNEKSADLRGRLRFDDRLDGEIARIRALPGVSEAEDIIHRHYAERRAELLNKARASAVITSSGDLGKRFMAVLEAADVPGFI